MRDSYDDSPQRSRDDGLRRLGRLTWRTTQLGTLATVGFAIVFARAAPAQTAGNDTVPPAAQSTAAHSAAPKTTKHPAKARTSGSPVATQSATGRYTPAAAVAGQPSVQPSTQPEVQPSATSSAPSATPTLAPPTTAPAPSSSSPAPTATSTTHGGG